MNDEPDKPGREFPYVIAFGTTLVIATLSWRVGYYMGRQYTINELSDAIVRIIGTPRDSLRWDNALDEGIGQGGPYQEHRQFQKEEDKMDAFMDRADSELKRLKGKQ